MLDNAKNRENRRYSSIARVKSPRLFTEDAFLKDISVTGCCIECATQVDVKTDTEYTITVHPEKESKVHNFDLLVECKWTHFDSSSCSIGFAVKLSPKKGDFLKYVDYLSWRHRNENAPTQ